MIKAIPFSANAKIGACHATYAPPQTCPRSCPFLPAKFGGNGAGCYAAQGNIGAFIWPRLEREAREANATPRELAILEADHIDHLRPVVPLRVHVTGDCPDAETAGIVGAAMARYDQRADTRGARGAYAWTYSHAWQEIPINAWHGARVLASCHSAEQIREADAAGYAVAAVITSPSRRAYSGEPYGLPGWRFVPCPAEYHEPGARVVTCADCQLCRHPERLRAGRLAVAFKGKGNR